MTSIGGAAGPVQQGCLDGPGRSILLGLELLVAADIVRTVGT